MFDFQFGRSFFNHIGIAMHIILVKISRNSVLLINNPSKEVTWKLWCDPRFPCHLK